MVRYGMLIDLKSCFGDRACFVACKNVNEIPVGEYKGREYYRIRPRDIELGTYPYVVRNTTPILCMQCQNPPCVDACPTTGAIYKRSDGIVVVDEKKCTGCQFCVSACPYDALYYRADKKVVDKCDFCASELDAGKQPVCVTNCPGEAMVFGDLDNPNSELSVKIRELNAKLLHPEYGTKPSVYYKPHAAVLHAAVADSAGGVVQGANAMLTDLETGAAVTVTADKEGRLFFRRLKVGEVYSLTVNVDGYYTKMLGAVYIRDEYTDLKTISLYKRV
jgi:Fe-S-cluster-containing dehydrogenase component